MCRTRSLLHPRRDNRWRAAESNTTPSVANIAFGAEPLALDHDGRDKAVELPSAIFGPLILSPRSCRCGLAPSLWRGPPPQNRRSHRRKFLRTSISALATVGGNSGQPVRRLKRKPAELSFRYCGPPTKGAITARTQHQGQGPPPPMCRRQRASGGAAWGPGQEEKWRSIGEKSARTFATWAEMECPSTKGYGDVP